MLQPAGEQARQIIQLTKEGRTTGEIAGMLGLPENQVLYHKRKFPLKSGIVSISVSPHVWFPGIPYIVTFRAVLADGREITLGTIKYGGPSPKQQNDVQRVLLALARFIGEEIEYAARRASRGTQRRESERPYFEAKFGKLPRAMKEVFGYR